MSEIQFEECSLEEATHVEMGGKVHKFDPKGIAFVYWREKVNRYGVASKTRMGINLLVGVNDWQFIDKDTFPTLGIKPLKEEEEEKK